MSFANNPVVSQEVQEMIDSVAKWEKTGEELTRLGDDYGVTRKEGEDDEAYRSRIYRELERPPLRGDKS